MTEADRWRICPHPELVRTRRPDILPVAPNNIVRWIITPRMKKPPVVHRCISCGQVGEKAVNGS